jgi:hypothetical protein
MKIALVLHGRVGILEGKQRGLPEHIAGTPIDLDFCASCFKKYLIQDYDVDIFIHSWSVDQKQKLLECYPPKLYHIEPQEYFGLDPDRVDHADAEQRYDSLTLDIFRCRSRFLSLKRANDLKMRHELENGFKYDWVVLTRPDLVIFKPINFAELNHNKIYTSLDPHWADPYAVKLVTDMIFVGDSLTMDKMALVSDSVTPYSNEPHSICFNHISQLEQKGLLPHPCIGFCTQGQVGVNIYRIYYGELTCTSL